MDANIAVTQFTGAAVFVWGMEQLKSWPWFPILKKEGQVWLKRGASIAAAIGIHTGISYVWNPPQITAMDQGYNLLIHIPPLAVIVVTMWHWLGQYAMQETLYQATSNKVMVTNGPKP